MMKKQILILTFFVLAALASTTTAFGQLLPSSVTPQPLSCSGTSEPLHPQAGIPYTYKLDGSTGETPATTWTWWATKTPDFISNGSLNTGAALSKSTSTELLDASTNYATSTSGADSVQITWSPEILAGTKYQGDPAAAGTAADPSPTFVVGVADGDCANNIQVYEINPLPSFTVDIANIDGTGSTMPYGADTSQCVDIVRTAKYNSTSHALDMDYGADTLYFEIIAANFVTSWTPYIQATSGFTSPQTADILLATTLANAQAGTALTPVSGNATGTLTVGTDWVGPVLNAATPGNTSTGVSIWARVIIANKTFESLTSQAFTLAVDGLDASNQWDIDDLNCSDPKNATENQADKATHNITPRPTLLDNTTPEAIPTPQDPITKTL